MTAFVRISLLSAAVIGGALLFAPRGTGGTIALATLLLWFLALGMGVACIRIGYFGPTFCRGGSELPEVALTFDDGPDPAVTPPLLDLLAELQVPAVFFCTGAHVEDSPSLARRITTEGHQLGNHSHCHAWWTNFLRRRGLVDEIRRAQQAIETATSMRPRLYRPPVGLTNPHLHKALRELDLMIMGWDVRSLDRNARDPQQVIARVLRGVRPGSIVLLHDGGVAPAPLLAIVRGVVEGLRARGYRLVRADKFLCDPDGSTLAPGKPK